MKESKGFMSNFFSLKLFLIIAVVSLCFAEASAKKNKTDLQWQKTHNGQIISLRRNKGDALAVRQRLVHLTEKEQAKISTELSHLTSGCALELNWYLADMTKQKHSLEPAQRGLRQLAKQIKDSTWSALKQGTSSLSFKVELPKGTELAQIDWFGCTRAIERPQEKPPETGLKGKKRPTLPNGARSTRAIGMDSILGQSKPSAKELQSELRGKSLILRSPNWAFAVVIRGPKAPSKVNEGWTWHDQGVQKAQKTEKEQESGVKKEREKPLKLQISIIHATAPLTPINPFVDDFTVADQSQKEWQILSDFLSYEEGIIDGLGKQSQSWSWASLMLMATLNEADLAKLSASWCEAALVAALKSLPAWPHIFKAYMRPMKPLDGRLMLPIALAQYLFRHPEGKKRAEDFLKTKFKGIMLSSVVKRHMQDIIGRASFFANRPAQKHLIAVSETEADELKQEGLEYSFTESVAIMPKTLAAIEQFLSDDQMKRVLGAPIGLALRATKVQAAWAEKARPFFRRQLEVYEARSRIENWGRFLELKDPESASLSIKANIKYYTDRLNHTPPSLSAYVAFDILWGQHDHFELEDLLNSVRPYPAGLVSEQGLLLKNDLPFRSELSPLDLSQLMPNTGAGALWIYALNRQLKRKWPYKLIIKLEDSRLALWNGLKSGANQENHQKHTKHMDAWHSPHLSFFDTLALFISEPPPIEAKQNVDSRELR